MEPESVHVTLNALHKEDLRFLCQHLGHTCRKKDSKKELIHQLMRHPESLWHTLESIEQACPTKQPTWEDTMRCGLRFWRQNVLEDNIAPHRSSAHTLHCPETGEHFCPVGMTRDPASGCCRELSNEYRHDLAHISQHGSLMTSREMATVLDETDVPTEEQVAMVSDAQAAETEMKAWMEAYHIGTIDQSWIQYMYVRMVYSVEIWVKRNLSSSVEQLQEGKQAGWFSLENVKYLLRMVRDSGIHLFFVALRSPRFMYLMTKALFWFKKQICLEWSITEGMFKLGQRHFPGEKAAKNVMAAFQDYLLVMVKGRMVDPFIDMMMIPLGLIPKIGPLLISLIPAIKAISREVVDTYILKELLTGSVKHLFELFTTPCLNYVVVENHFGPIDSASWLGQVGLESTVPLREAVKLEEMPHGIKGHRAKEELWKRARQDPKFDPMTIYTGPYDPHRDQYYEA